MLLRPTHKVEDFLVQKYCSKVLGNIFAPCDCDSLGTRTVCIKMWGKIQEVSSNRAKLNGRGYKNWRFSKSRFISKTVKDTPIVTMADQYEVDRRHVHWR